MQVILNKKEKEELVVKLHQENRTIRQIAEIVHMSFKGIGAIIRRIDGRTNDIDFSNKSKATQAMVLFKNGRKPLEVAIELDISSSEIEDILQEYWVLIGLDELALVYYEIRNDLDLFLRLFHTLKKYRLINQKDIQTVLRYAAFDIPYLENRKHVLTNDIINLGYKKSNLNQKLVLWNAQLSDLGRAIDSKNQQLKRIDK
jgi:hypothetical protein